jgi:hypothetical protein
MLKRLCMLALCAALVASSTAAFAESVYVTPNGKKYHKQDCRMIAKSKTVEAIELKEAVAQGFLPCGACFKAEANQAAGKNEASVNKDAEKTKKK